MNNLGTNLVKIRQQKGMTQEQLAELSDTTVNYVSKIERGIANNISAKLLVNLSKALNVTVDELISGTSHDEQNDPKNLNALIAYIQKLPADQAEAYCRQFVELIKLGQNK